MSAQQFKLKVFHKTMPQATEHTLSIHINGAVVNNIATFHDLLKEPLALPGYYGDNLDAMFDVLSDLACLKEKPVQFVITDFDDWLDEETPEFKIQTLFVLLDAAQSWADMKGSDAYFQVYIQKANTLDEILEVCEIEFEEIK